MILTKPQMEAEGIKGPWVVGVKDYTRYGEIDNLNHVNNKVYSAWFENLRVLYLSDLGMDISLGGDVRPVIRMAQVEYIEQMRINEPYFCVARCSRVGRTSFDLEYAVIAEGRIKAKGLSVQVMVKGDGSETTPVPEEFKSIFISRDGATA